MGNPPIEFTKVPKYVRYVGRKVSENKISEAGDVSRVGQTRAFQKEIGKQVRHDTDDTAASQQQAMLFQAAYCLHNFVRPQVEDFSRRSFECVRIWCQWTNGSNH